MSWISFHSLVVSAFLLSSCSAMTSVNKLETGSYRVVAHGNAFQGLDALKQAIATQADELCGPSKVSVSYEGPVQIEEIQTRVDDQLTTVHAYLLSALVTCRGAIGR